MFLVLVRSSTQQSRPNQSQSELWTTAIVGIPERSRPLVTMLISRILWWSLVELGVMVVGCESSRRIVSFPFVTYHSTSSVLKRYVLWLTDLIRLVIDIVRAGSMGHPNSDHSTWPLPKINRFAKMRCIFSVRFNRYPDQSATFSLYLFHSGKIWSSSHRTGDPDWTGLA